MKSLCAEPRPEDGVPPHVLKKQQLREERPPRSGQPAGDARARQYCKAAQRSLEAGIAGLSGAEFRDLTVQSVEPLRTGAHLLVVVTAPPADHDSLLALERSLQKSAGMLRSGIALEIRRKRTPHLTFRVVPET